MEQETTLQIILDRLQTLQTGQDEMRGDIKSLQVGQDEMRGDIAGLKTDVVSLRAGQEEMRGDIKSLQAGQEEMRGDIAGLKTDVASLRSGQEEMRGDIRTLQEGQEELHEMFATFVETAATKEDIANIRSEMALEKTMEREFSEMRAHMRSELDSITHDIERIETAIERIKKAGDEDTTAISSEVADVKKRVAILEIGYTKLTQQQAPQTT